MKFTIEIADEDVAKLFVLNGVAPAAPEAAAPKPATKATKAAAAPKAEAAPKPADAPAVSKDDVFKSLNEHAKRNTKDAAVAILQKHAPTLGKLDEKLYATVKAELDADLTAAPAEEDPFA